LGPVEGPKQYKRIQVVLPIGAGIKIPFDRYWGMKVEAMYRFTFTDYIDDVGTDAYMDASVLESINGAQAVALSNRSLDGSFQGRRGNSTNKDWYVYAGGMLTFRLGKGNNCPVIR
jgi:hypothetical protein